MSDPVVTVVPSFRTATTLPPGVERTVASATSADCAESGAASGAAQRKT